MKLVIPYDGHEHLGLGYLASRARSAGWDVSVLPVIKTDYIRGKWGDQHLPRQNAVDRIIALQPDVVAMSVNSFQAEEYFALSRSLHQRGIRTLAGGPHATAEPALTLGLGRFDAVVTGEADDVLEEALEHVVHPHGTTPPWLYTSTHDASSAPPPQDLDRIPVPAKELFYDHAPFEARDYKVLTARGCPYRCIFCTHSAGGAMSALRRRGIGSIIDELRFSRERYAPSTVYIMDDIFTYDAAWLGEFLVAYKRHVALPFHAITHPRHLNAEVAAMLAGAGCFKLRLGVQSLTPAARRLLGRPETNDDIREALAAARSSRIRIEVDHMVNVPGERLEDARQGVLFYNEHRPHSIKVYWLLALPGTRWFSWSVREGTIEATLAEQIRRGTAIGDHSYLFTSGNGTAQREWLGIHILLGYLPFLPRAVVRWLVRHRIDRFLRIRSFVLAVGIPRLLTMLCGGDKVGEMHMLRLWRNAGYSRRTH